MTGIKEEEEEEVNLKPFERVQELESIVSKEWVFLEESHLSMFESPLYEFQAKGLHINCGYPRDGKLLQVCEHLVQMVVSMIVILSALPVHK